METPDPPFMTPRFRANMTPHDVKKIRGVGYISISNVGYIFREPVNVQDLGLKNPSKQGLFQSKQGSSKGTSTRLKKQIYTPKSGRFGTVVTIASVQDGDFSDIAAPVPLQRKNRNFGSAKKENMRKSAEKWRYLEDHPNIIPFSKWLIVMVIGFVPFQLA